MVNFNIEKLSNDPEIFTIDNFLSSTECNEFIEIGTPIMQRSLVAGDKEGYISNGRTNNNCWINHNYSEITKIIAERISCLIDVPLTHAENYQIIHYDENQRYNQHYDGWKHDKTEKTYRYLNIGGQRMYTCLCYLNDVIEGGETKFTKLNISVLPKKGRLLVFKNVYNGTNKLHELSEHAGCPVIKGQKFAFNLWFRETPRDRPYNFYNPDYYKNS